MIAVTKWFDKITMSGSVPTMSRPASTMSVCGFTVRGPRLAMSDASPRFKPRWAGFRTLLASLRSYFEGPSQGAARAQFVQEVWSLDPVAGFGETPAAYGWHVDEQLHVRAHFAGEPIQAILHAPAAQPDDEPPQRGFTARVYRVPRSRRPSRRLAGAAAMG